MKRPPCHWTAATLFLTLGLGLLACGGCAGQRPVAAGSAEAGDTAVAESPAAWHQGTIRLVGNQPHAELVLTVPPAAADPAATSLDYYLTGPLSQAAGQLVYQVVEIYGRSRQLELRLAGSSGRTRLRHELYAEIIRPQP